MNKTLYKQADSRWGSKPYPVKSSSFAGNGCGCVACTHIIMEQSKYANYTPENLRPWMISQGFAVTNQGTTWNGIKKTLEHYGYKVVHVGVSDPMSKAWAELDKGNRIGVILFKSGKAPNGTVWTTGGHYVAFTDYYVKNGKHYFYTKDSGSRNHDSKTNGYYTYENSMKGTVYQMWIVERLKESTVSTTTTSTTTTTVNKLTVDGKFGPNSIKGLQQVLGTKVDGHIDGQLSSLKKYHTGFTSGINYGSGGSACVKALQKMLGLSGPDGQLGPNTIKAFQKYLGLSGPDGYWGPNTSKAAQKWINSKLTPSTPSTPTPTPTPTPDPTPAPVVSATKFKGMDISAWQDTISTANFKKAMASGIQFVILRVGYTGSSSKKPTIDSVFENNYKNAIAAGLPVGIYFYSLATTAAAAKQEANFVLEKLKGKKITYPVYLDVEDNATQGKASKSALATVCNTFCETIAADGYKAGVYASLSWFNSKIGTITAPHTKWVAQYYSECQYKGAYDVWQYSSSESVPGIASRTDVNWCYRDFPAELVAKATKSVEEIAQEVLDGKWGSGNDRITNLYNAGYDYNAVQHRVNELIEQMAEEAHLKAEAEAKAKAEEEARRKAEEEARHKAEEEAKAKAELIDKLAHEVLEGKWGSGDDRKKRIEAAGYDYYAVQKRVNEFIEEKKTLVDRELEACAAQAQWMKNAAYKWESNPTIAKSKNKGTCVTYVACVLQRLGILDSGKYVWQNGEGYGTGKVVGANNKMDVKYMNNKTLESLKSQLQAGDIILVDDNKSGEAGSGGHIFILTGKWTDDGKPYIWDNASGQNKTYNCKAHTYGATRKVLARIRLKDSLTPKKTIDELVQEVLDGKWGSGDTRKANLLSAGYDYDAVQARINEILSTPQPNSYTGELPTLKMIKSNAEVINDACKWARWIAGDNRFHYGYTNKHGSTDTKKWNPNAHHNGCYFCGTQKLSGGCSKKGIVDYEYSYCCNPFVGAAWAHGGCVPKALSLCQDCSSWDYHAGKGYDSSSLFTNLGKPAKSSLKKGDVCCTDSHVFLYLGDGKLAEASGGDDNVRNSEKWNNSIHVISLSDSKYKGIKRVHRYNGSVNTEMLIRHGEVSNRVALWQAFLDWYFDGQVGSADGYYGDNTLKWTKEFQEKEIGTGEGDGIVGQKTLDAAAKCKKK